MKKCLKCNKTICFQNKSGLCQDCYRKKINQEKIDTWKKSGDTGCGVATTLRNCIRNYILNKQNHKCLICGNIDNWNNKPIKFILDHIDGNAANNKEDNLRLICPNCDSQLPTFKSKNKNSARKHRLEGCQNGNGTDLKSDVT